MQSPEKKYQMLHNVFLEAGNDTKSPADFGIAGIPFDGTLTYKPGARFAPDEIRQASWSLETYSPVLEKDLSSKKYVDWGNLELPIGDTAECLRHIIAFARDVSSRKMVFLGGEHLITFPIFSAYQEKYPDICLVQMDAHADLRFSYLDNLYSHATVMHQCLKKIPLENFFQIGIRSGTAEECALIKKYGWLYTCDEKSIAEIVKKINGRPVYLTIDLDVFDPSQVPGTGTPEPGGLTWSDYQTFLQATRGMNIAAFDVVELSPPYDPSKNSAVFASKIVRETVLNYWY